MSGSTMAMYPSWPFGKKRLKSVVFYAAKEGKVEDLRSALSGLRLDLVKEVLHHCSLGEMGGTPLSAAAQHGHLEVVRLLVENFCVDVAQTVTAEGSSKMTALMCASRHGHLDVVKLLVTRGCPVNLANEDKITALLFACESNCLEVVKYLVENGACIEDTASDGFNCLMAACRQKHVELVKYLLEKGVNVNKMTDTKDTALHIAARGDAAEVVEVLLENGAAMSENSEGYSPLTEAAIACSKNVVSFVVQSLHFSRRDKIDTLELVGAMMAKENVTAALAYLKHAMALRYENPRDFIPKPQALLPASSSFLESRTMEELEAREIHQLRLECLAIEQRQFGPNSCRFVEDCTRYCRELCQAGLVSDALITSVHALGGVKRVYASTNTIVSFIRSTLFLVLRGDPPPSFPCVCEVLEVSLHVLRQNKPPSRQRKMLNRDFAYISLCCILVGLQAAKDQEDMAALRELTESLIHLQPVFAKGTPILHAAVSMCLDILGYTRAQDPHVDAVVSFLCACGADVNAADKDKNRPLHVIARCHKRYIAAKTLCNMIRSMVEADAPVNALNMRGKTPLDIAGTKEVASVLREFYPISLKCLAASAVVKHRTPYTGQVPEIIQEFLRRH